MRIPGKVIALVATTRFEAESDELSPDIYSQDVVDGGSLDCQYTATNFDCVGRPRAIAFTPGGRSAGMVARNTLPHGASCWVSCGGNGDGTSS